MKPLTAAGLLALTLSVSVHAADFPAVCKTGSLPSHDLKYPADQLILTCIPHNWNGQLIVFAHGYVAPQEPLALPLDQLTFPNGTTVPDILVPLGFAFATSSYHKNGYAVEQGANDLNALVAYFKTLKGARGLKQVLLTGASEGSSVTALLLEKFPRTYAGALATCGPLGGSPYQTQYLGDFPTVFNYFFPTVLPFALTNVPADAYLDWDTVYTPAITEAVTADPSTTTQLFQVTHAQNPQDLSTAATTSTDALFFTVWGSNDVIEVMGGQPYDNQNITYQGSANDTALNQGVVRFKADPVAQAYAKRFYQPTGNLQRPLVTLHTTGDDVVPFTHELIYQQQVALAGKQQFLTTLPVNRYGHCNFTPGELLGSLALLLQQVSVTPPPALATYLKELPPPLK